MDFRNPYLDAIHTKINPTDDGIDVVFYGNENLQRALSAIHGQTAGGLVSDLRCAGKWISLSHKAYVFLEALCAENHGSDYCQDVLTNGYLSTIKDLTESGMPEKQATFVTANQYLSKMQLPDSEKNVAENTIKELMFDEYDWRSTG